MAEIGKTDANGLLETSAMKELQPARSACSRLSVPKGVAEATKVTVLADAAGTEYTAVHLNAVQGSSTNQNISWLSGLSTGGKAVVQYRVKGTDAWADGRWHLYAHRFLHLQGCGLYQHHSAYGPDGRHGL